MRSLVLIVVAVFVLAGDAMAHAPATAIGRAVLALEQVSVSYDPASRVSEVEAGGFPVIVADGPKVAFLPASAREEIAGGPDAVAGEIAREAALDGTLVVLVGTELGAWSDEIGEERLAELVRDAEATAQGSPAARTEALVRSVQAEPTGSGMPWGWIAAVLVVAAVALLVAYDRLVRRRVRT